MTRRANHIEWARAPWRARGAFSGGALALSMLCSACAVGPDFVAPPPPEVERYTPEKTASPGNGQRFVEDSEVPERWWTAFRSEPLDQLIDEAIKRNPTLQAAEAAIQAADYNTDAAIGGFFPQVVLGSNSSYNYPSGDFDDQHRHPNCFFLLFQIRSSQLHSRRLGRQLAQGGGPRGPAPGPDFSEAGRL